MNQMDKLKTTELMLKCSMQNTAAYYIKRLGNTVKLNRFNSEFIEKNIKQIYIGYKSFVIITGQEPMNPDDFMNTASAVMFLGHMAKNIYTDILTILGGNLVQIDSRTIKENIKAFSDCLDDLKKSYGHVIEFAKTIKFFDEIAKEIETDEDIMMHHLAKIYEFLMEKNPNFLVLLSSPFAMGVYLNYELRIEQKELVPTVSRLAEITRQALKLEVYLDAMIRYILTGEEIREEDLAMENTQDYAKKVIVDILRPKYGRKDDLFIMKNFSNYMQWQWIDIAYKENVLLKMQELIDRKYKEIEESAIEYKELYTPVPVFVQSDNGRLH